MRHRIVALFALGLACTMETDVDIDRSNVYTKAEIDSMFGFLDACEPGDMIVRDATGWTCGAHRLCPPGFAATIDGAYTVCTRSTFGVADTMVKAGDFWIDRYEMSACPGSGDLGGASGYATTASACSVSGVAPTTNVSWFQAVELCANAGKALCTNAEWQIAAAGTPDPGAFPNAVDCNASASVAGQCNTCSTEARATGQGAECRSRWGVEDMIGNVWEWTDDWHASGYPWMSVDGQGIVPWAAATGFGDDADATYNINGYTSDGVAWRAGAPGAPIRGGAFNNGRSGGTFAFNASHSPAFVSTAVTARCCAAVGGR